MSVQVQAPSFSAAQLLDQLQARCTGAGAVASFVGLVRDYGDAGEVRALFLEHYSSGGVGGRCGGRGSGYRAFADRTSTWTRYRHS